MTPACDATGPACGDTQAFPATDSVNASTAYEEEGPRGVFFDVYFSRTRFVVETSFACVSALTNAYALAVIARARRRRHTVYHTLFLNLAAVNVVSCAVSWLCNNTLFLFRRRLLALALAGDSCRLMIVLSATMFASCSFSLVGACTLLGLTVIQYVAICKPMQHAGMVRGSYVRAFSVSSWLISLATALLPFVGLVVLVHVRPCTPAVSRYIHLTSVVGIDLVVAMVTLSHVVMMAMFVRIYVEIRRLRRRLSRMQLIGSPSPADRHAVYTTMALLASVFVLSVPYTVMHILSTNSIISDATWSAATIYFMNLLPYCKMFTDTVIYGARMRELRGGFQQMFVACQRLRSTTDDEQVAMTSVVRTTNIDDPSNA